MKIFKILFLSILAISQVLLINSIWAQPQDVQCWSKARWGMTEEEILKAFPGEAQHVEKPIKYKHATVTAAINNLDLGVAGKFRVLFLMGDETKKLVQVNITTMDENPVGVDSLFVTLERMLVEKYGQPAHKSGKKYISRNSSTNETTWSFPSTQIQLSAIEFSLDSGQIVISYKPRSKHLDKL